MTTFEKGYRAFSDMSVANLSASSGVNYVSGIENAISDLEHLINVELRLNKDGTVTKASIETLKGDAAEYWHSGTHNIDAAVKGISSRTKVIRSHVTGSVDVQGNWNDSNYGLKYIASGEASAGQQSQTYGGKYDIYKNKKINKGLPFQSYDEYYKEQYEKYLRECTNSNTEQLPIEQVFPGASDPNNPLYMGQYRIIPKDQLENAREWLENEIREAQINGSSDQIKRYQDTLDRLDDRIRSNEGSTSIPLSKEEAEHLAALAIEAGFDPSKWGLTTEELIEWMHIMQQANAAGLSAALISVILEVAPELVKIMLRLFRDGEADVEDFKRLGFASLKAPTLGYVRGSVASAITIACKSGKLCVALKNADPTIIGAVVTITMNTMQNATLMAFGQMTTGEFANRCVQDLLVTSCSLAMGAVLQSLLPQLPVIGYMLGSFVGGVVGSFVYQTGYSCALSYCIKSGCTFFGLVKQDYTLPNEVLRELGLELFEYENFNYEDFVYEEFVDSPFMYAPFEYESINIRILRRGVIGVNKIGFVI
jgi:hypothetical protein